MTKVWHKAVLVVLVALCQAGSAADENSGALGKTSMGHIRLSLEVSEDISAGFLQTTLGEEDSELQEVLSSQMVESLRTDSNTTLPLCVMSSGGGYFELSSFEAPMTSGDKLDSELDVTVPVSITFGNEEAQSLRFQSVDGQCSQEQTIPVTIQLKGDISGEEVGRIYGKFNLLVKSE